MINRSNVKYTSGPRLLSKPPCLPWPQRSSFLLKLMALDDARDAEATLNDRLNIYCVLISADGKLSITIINNLCSTLRKKVSSLIIKVIISQFYLIDIYYYIIFFLSR